MAKRELYASPGDRNFSEREPISYVGSGMLGNGLFGLYLGEIVLNGYSSSQYKGEEVTGTRRLARYDYQISVMWSGQTVDVPGDQARWVCMVRTGWTRRELRTRSGWS